MTLIWPGKPYPLGATWDGQGVNFAMFSQHATGVELCLFDSPDAPHERERIAMREHTDNVWHAYLPGIQPGQAYGYRVYGPYNPEAGHRFSPAKLLVDPYATALDRAYAFHPGLSEKDRDTADLVPKGIVKRPLPQVKRAPPRLPAQRLIRRYILTTTPVTTRRWPRCRALSTQHSRYMALHRLP